MTSADHPVPLRKSHERCLERKPWTAGQSSPVSNPTASTYNQDHFPLKPSAYHLDYNHNEKYSKNKIETLVINIKNHIK